MFGPLPPAPVLCSLIPMLHF